MPVIVKDPTLPAGWEALYDEGQQVTYYWQRATGTVTYDKPAPVAAAAPVGPSALPCRTKLLHYRSISYCSNRSAERKFSL